MNRILLLLSFFLLCKPGMPQQIVCDNPLIGSACSLAIQTISNNTREGILAAGADYGGEWTRDIAINSWNAVSLLQPELAKRSLWSVTLHGDTIGHQYWDKILWVVAAYHHYLLSGDAEFLKKAYHCSANTMSELEALAFDPVSGLFKGPSVFNDGIAGYPEPIFIPSIENSYVLTHPGSRQIKCLSTNCVYYAAYKALQLMAEKSDEPSISSDYSQKAANLRASIYRNLYSRESGQFMYFTDSTGRPYAYQEGLGISFAVISGLAGGDTAERLISHAVTSPFGIPSVSPDFPRFSKEKPGRHNRIIWPMVNGFYAKAAIMTGQKDIFTREFFNLAHLAMDPDKGNMDFREIYHPETGVPDGGWQLGSHWTSCHHQTWSATAFLSMIFDGLAGLQYEENHLWLTPFLPEGISYLKLDSLHYRGAEICLILKGQGSTIQTVTIDGAPVDEAIFPAGLTGRHEMAINLKND